MSQVQPITIEEQDHYEATRKVTRCATRTPAKYKAKKLSGPAVSRTLATFGAPTNLPGFEFPIGSTVRTTNGSIAWTVVAQAETPAGTSPRSYRITSGRMEKVVGENALRPTQEAPKKMAVIDVALNPKTRQIEPVDPFARVRASKEISQLGTTPEKYNFKAVARTELKSMLDASVAPTLAPTIDEPALHTVEPMACRFTKVESWRQDGRAERPAPTTRSTEPKVRLNAPFAPTATVTVLVANPKKPGSKSHERFALYQTGETVAQQIEAGVLMIDVKWDAEHGFIRVG